MTGVRVGWGGAGVNREIPWSPAVVLYRNLYSFFTGMSTTTTAPDSPVGLNFEGGVGDKDKTRTLLPPLSSLSSFRLRRSKEGGRGVRWGFFVGGDSIITTLGPNRHSDTPRKSNSWHYHRGRGGVSTVRGNEEDVRK